MLVRKATSLSDADIKLDGDSGRFTGYASVFGGVDAYGDTIVRGAYAYTLKHNGKPRMFFNHNSDALPVGRWLVAKEDDHGLYVEGEFTPGNPMAEAVRASLKHGVVDGLSVGFYMKSGDYEMLDDGRRIINRISNLVEVSVVTFPADTAARIDLESVKANYGEALDEIESIKDLERFLRDAGGFSKGLALALVSRAKVILGRSDSGATDADANAVRLLAERFRAMGERLPL